MKSVPKLIRRFIAILLLSTILLFFLNIIVLFTLNLKQTPLRRIPLARVMSFQKLPLQN